MTDPSATPSGATSLRPSEATPARPSGAAPPRFAAVAAVNDEESLARNLARSPMIASGAVPLRVERGAPSAAAAYNRGIAATDAPVLLLVHQDVYFPEGFEDRLAAAIAAVEARDPLWGVIGAYGVDADGAGHGRLWSSSVGGLMGRPADPPVPVESLDELLLVMRRGAGLLFDEDPPLWHLYGTDIVQAARAAGAGAWAADLPLVHNDGFHGRLGPDFAAGYHHVRRKWRRRLPIRTPVVRVDRWGLGLPIYRLRAARSYARREAMALDTAADPRLYAARCGWEDPGGAADPPEAARRPAAPPEETP